jgi:hypothetical protein
MGTLFLAGCARETPPTGARIEVVNGDGVTTPRYLLFDWRNNDSVLVHDRRVPASGFLDPAARPLAVVRIAADAVTDPQRHIVVRGMVDEEMVSQGEGSLQIQMGSWQTTTVVLMGAVQNPDAGAPADGPDAVGDAAPADAADDQAVADLAPSDVAPEGALPPPPPLDAAPVDLAPDLPGPDLPRDVTADLPAAMVTLPATADSFVEQGQTSSGSNFGKATSLEVKTQAGADNNRIAFFRFSLTPVAGTTPLTATLRVYGKAVMGTDMDSAYGVIDETWTEAGITWNNKPALGMKLATVSVGTTGQYREWNVTAFVKGQQAMGRDNVNFAISMDGDTVSSPDTFNSREATRDQPQLVITR